MRRVSFNPFKQREINVSVDTFCKIERFRHRRHICFYVKKREKKMRRHLSLRPSFFPFLSYSFLPLFFIFLLFSFFFLIHSLARRMLTEREREREGRYRTRYRTPLIPWQWFEAWRKVFEGSTIGGNPFSSPRQDDRSYTFSIVSPRRDSHAKRADTRGWIPPIFSWSGTSIW